MDGPSWEQRQQPKEETFDEKVREIMFKRRITYIEAADLVKNGQKSLGEY